MKIAALVLAGGKSKRMNGNNKAFLQYKNKSFIENITGQLIGFNNIYISVDNKENYKELKFDLVEDIYTDIGPIGGIYSALKYINEDYVFVVACDMPKITKQFAKYLCDIITGEEKALVVRDKSGKIHPLGGIYSKNIIPEIEEMILQKDYKLLNLLSKVNAKIVSLSETEFDIDILGNINNIKEYEKLNK